MFMIRYRNSHNFLNVGDLTLKKSNILPRFHYFCIILKRSLQFSFILTENVFKKLLYSCILLIKLRSTLLMNLRHYRVNHSDCLGQEKKK